MDPKVFVARPSEASEPIVFSSGVSGRELLEFVREEFGVGTVKSCSGVIVTSNVPSVPDGSYTFDPKQSGVVDDKATIFWHQFAQLNMLSGAIVTLPQNPLSLLPYEESFFYVHPVYYRLWDIINKHSARSLITGTAGVGKTSMLLFMLCQLAKTGCDIVLDFFSKGVGRFLIKGGKVYQGEDFDFRAELSSPECWYLCDVRLPDQVAAKTVLVCSISNGVLPVEVVALYSDSSGLLSPPHQAKLLQLAAKSD